MADQVDDDEIEIEQQVDEDKTLEATLNAQPSKIKCKKSRDVICFDNKHLKVLGRFELFENKDHHIVHAIQCNEKFGYVSKETDYSER